ncbi:JmjC domain-containing protein [Paraburkholderia sp. IW21]|uniref:JmjC domain-containing protein n=1 Tax=Paraburkholderia sp. IW21 TaxID=3242488 RepID=UPI00351FB58A
MNGSDFAQYILGDADFRSHYGEKKFWHSHFLETRVHKIFSWEHLNACLSHNRITNDRFRMSTEYEHNLLNKRAFRPVRDKFGRSTDYLVISELHQLMREGVTAVLEAINELSPNVGDLTERLGGELGAQSTANAYISFGDTSGFGVHNDDHDVIVMQIDGKKKWRFFRSGTIQEKATVNELKHPSESDRGDELIITAGDIMFIPKGTWHDVVAVNEKSLHLTISLVYPTVVDFVNWGLARDKFGIPYADFRPSKVEREGLSYKCREYFNRLINEENIEIFLRAFYAGHAGSRVRANFPFLNSASLEDGFRRIPFDVVVLNTEEDDECVKTFALGRIHELAPEEYALLRRLPHTGAMRGKALIPVDEAWDSVASTLRSLMDRGLVGKVALTESRA